MSKEQELKLFQKARKLIKQGYGADCPMKDIDSYVIFDKKDLETRCGSCVAKELIGYLDWHIDLLKWCAKNNL